LHLLKITTGSVDHEGLAEGNDTLLGSRDGALEEEEVVLDDTVVGETTHGSDSLLGNIVFSGGIVVIFAEANTVDFLVDLRSVVVTICEAEALL
jgi:hypothetical protein